MIWRTVQTCALLVTLLLIAGLFKYPDMTLALLWNVLIPLLPLTFLFTPILWRSLCPLATLNMLPNGLVARRQLSRQALTRVSTTGIVLLAFLVPARRFLFNEHGEILAITIIAISVLALCAGMFFNAKSGFCNAICPVLPVEKLYGQHPLWDIKNPRCSTCDLCTAKGCIDVAPKKAVRPLVGPPSSSRSWLLTSYGLFATGFPGFIAGYFTTPDVPLALAYQPLLHITAFTLSSIAVLSGLIWLFRTQAKVALPVLAALSLAIYYWYAIPGIADMLQINTSAILYIRSAIFGITGFWLGRALQQTFNQTRSRKHTFPSLKKRGAHNQLTSSASVLSSK